MSEFLIDENAALQCAHAGQARPLSVSRRVKAGGQLVAIQSTSYSITGCSLSSSGSPPCSTANFMSAATRVKADGLPVLLKNSQSTCTPTGTALLVLSTQTKVKGI